MFKQPLVSVIVTGKNCRDTILETLNSLKEQSYSRFEVIFVDGVSNDGTYEAAEEFSRDWSKLQVFRYDKNPASGRNYGISQAKGDILAFIDADAYAERDWLSKLTYYLLNSPSNVVGVGGPNVTPLNDPITAKCIGFLLSTFFGSFRSRNPKLWKNERFVDHHPFCNVSFRREVFKKVGLLNEGLNVGEDVEFGFRIGRHGYKLLYIPYAVVYHHRRHTIKGFAKQMYGYGYWRAVLGKLHRGLVKPHHSLPVLLLVVFTMLPITYFMVIANVVSYILLVFNLVCILSYLTLGLLVGVYGVVKLKTLKAFPLIFILSVLEHLSYGLGFISGVIKGHYSTT